MQEPTEVERQAALTQALNGQPLRRSPKLRELLAYICDERRTGQPEQLAEREIGIAVFGRPEHYDSNADNIVRVQARNLRKRLETYYEGEGAEDPVRIEIPKGHYLPEFTRRSDGLLAARVERRVRWRRTAASVVAAAALLTAGFHLGRRNQPSASLHARGARSIHPPWAALLNEDRPTMLLVSDNTYSMSQRLLARSVTLEEYLAGGVEYPFRARTVVPKNLRGDRDYFDLIAWREQTSFTSLSAATRIVQLAGPLADRIELQFPRDLHARDLTGKHVVVLGSRRTIPWIELYQDQFAFRYHYDEGDGAPYFMNLTPRPGEQDVFRRGGPDGSSSETYSHLALLPNFDGEGRVLFVSGAGDAAQTALANYLLTDVQARGLLDDIGVTDADSPCCFEAILRSSRIHGTSNTVEVVAARTYDSSASWRVTQDR